MYVFDMILSVFPVAECFFAASILLWMYIKKKAIHYLYLHVFYGLLGLFYLMSVFFYFEDLQTLSIMFTFSLPVTLSLFPAFYLYLRSLTGPSLPGRTTILLHFIVPLLFLFVLLPFQFLSYEVRMAFISRENPSWLADYSLLNTIRAVYRFAVIYFINIQFVIYLLLMGRELLLYRRRIEERFSFKENIDLEWVGYSIFFFAMLTILINFSHYIGVSAYIYSRMTFNIISVILVFFLFIKGFSQRNVFIPDNLKPGIIPQSVSDFYIPGYDQDDTEKPVNGNSFSEVMSEPRHKYQHSTLTPEVRRRILDNMQKLISEKVFFLQKDLDIDRLSEILKTNSTYLSQVINEDFGKNFFHFVNDLRIEEAKKHFGDKSNDKYTIEAIANSCGFNSRSSFHSAFKKATGYTPAEFRNNIRK